MLSLGGSLVKRNVGFVLECHFTKYAPSRNPYAFM